MPSARAAAIAGPMMVSSSSPNSPPSPACGFSPATAMRGVACPHRAAAACAMRRVCSTASKVTLSMARRSEVWMVTSTTRSSSLASIMRTSRAPASDASISVWPGKPMPAAANAFLWIGAVTMPPTSPRCASATARSMQRAAAAPARASMRPQGICARSLGKASSCSTGTQCGGVRSASAARSMRATASMPPSACAARRITSTSPITQHPAAAPCAKAFAMISGPMPATSPIVSACGRYASVMTVIVSADIAGLHRSLLVAAEAAAATHDNNSSPGACRRLTDPRP